MQFELPKPDGILPPYGASNLHNLHLLIPKDLISLGKGRNLPVHDPSSTSTALPVKWELLVLEMLVGLIPERPNLPWHDPAVIPEGRNVLFQELATPSEPRDAPGFAP